MRIAFIGDSYTLGTADDEPSDGYGFAGKVATQLGAEYERFVYYTFPAADTAWNEIVVYAPDVIVIELGIHMVTNSDPTPDNDFAQVVIAIIERSQLITDKVVYVEVAWRNPALSYWGAAGNDLAQDFNLIILNEAVQRGVRVARIYDVLADLGLDGVGYDSAHPNGVGHRAIANAVNAILSDWIVNENLQTPAVLSAFWIDIKYGGNVIGDGPITTATYWETTAPIDQAGKISFEMPASDPRATLVQAKREAWCYGLVNGAVILIGAGIIDTIELSLSPAGATMLKVGGDDLLRELTNRSVAFLELSDGAGGGSATALASVMALAPIGWSLDTVNGYSSTGTMPYGSFAGETVLAALRKIAEQTGQHFRLGEDRQVIWLRNDQSDSGLRAISDADPVAVETNDDVCLIQSLSESNDSYDLVTRIYAFGAGNGQARLSLADATQTPAMGYTIGQDSKGWYLVNTAAEAAMGQRIERFLSWKEISPVTNSEADIESAANALYDAAYQYLSRNSNVQKSYRLNVAKLDRQLWPGQTIRVIWREVIDAYITVDIDTDLYILETRTRIDSAGLRTIGLQVSTVDRWPVSDAELIASAMEEARLMDAHPQIVAGYYSRGFSDKNMDASNSAVFRFRLDNRITRLISAKLRFRSEIFEATSTAAQSSGQQTSNSNSQQTSGGGSSHNHTVTITVYGGNPSTAYDVYWDPDNNRFVLPSVGSGTDDALIQTSSSESTHTHTVAGHQHTIDGHTHALDYGIERNAGEYPGPISLEINGVDQTAALGGPWGSNVTSTNEVELEIADILNAGTLRQEHTLEFTCVGGQGRLVDVAIDCFVQVQAILLQ